MGIQQNKQLYNRKFLSNTQWTSIPQAFVIIVAYIIQYYIYSPISQTIVNTQK